MAASAVATDRTHHRGESSSPYPESNRPPIVGGTLSPTPLALIAAWCAYLRGVIGWPQFRVWLALVEVHTRHEIVKRRGADPFHFTPEYVIKALGVSAPMRRVDVEVALEHLAELGLVVMTKTKLIFVDDVAGILLPELRHEVVDLIGALKIGQILTKAMKIPRRMVSAWRQQGRGSRVGVGVLLGLLVRTMMNDDEYGDYRGCVTGAWLEIFSGGSRSSVKRRLQALEKTRLFERLPTCQRVLQRYGQWWRLNPQVPKEASVCGKVRDIGPPPCEQASEIGPPLKNQVSPVGRYRNQVHTMCAEPGAYQRLQNQKTDRPAPHVDEQTTHWWDIQSRHLKNRLSLESIHRQAVDRELMPAGDAGLREVAVQAQRVLRKAREREIRNPGAVLRWTLEHPEAPRDGAIEDDERARALLADLQGASRDEAAQLMTSVEATVADVASIGADNDPGCDEGRDGSAGEKGASPAECWHDNVYSPHGPVPGFDLPAAAAEGVVCRTCGSVVVDGQWCVEDQSTGDAGVEARGPSGEDVGRAGVEADSWSPTGSEVHLERLWSDDTDMTQGVVLASGGSAVSWYVCQHNDTHRRPVRFAGFDLESAAGVDREAGGLFCWTCEGWWVGDRWYRQDDEGGVRWYRRDDGGGVQAEAEAESGGRSAAGLRDPKVGDLACEKVEG